MPKEIPLVSELEWYVVDLNHVNFHGQSYTRPSIATWSDGWINVSGPKGTILAWASHSCREKLLAAMDSFGKVEEPKYWELLAHFSKEPSAIYAKSLLELRSRIKKLEGKVKS